MRHTAISKFIGYFRKIEFDIQQQFFYLFNLVIDDKVFHDSAGCFRKYMGEAGIIRL
ncbi:MAG TPA: hypothetical protein PLY34_18565 [Ferruginibacter sp.]|nr:hypothetical protein [Ferruginibacter sp.]